MSDDKPDNEKPAKRKRARFKNYDPAFSALVAVASGDDDRSPNNFTVCVVVQGTVVVGQLCSPGAWAEAVGKVETATETASEFMAGLSESFDENIPKTYEDRDDRPPREFFHMINSTIVGPTTIQAATFRGRITEVGGWSFPGSYNTPDGE